MENQGKIEQKFQKLILKGNQVLRTNGWNGRLWNTHPSEVDYLEFRTESLNLLSKVCGKDSEHYLELKRIAENEKTANSSNYFHICFGVLKAAHNDFAEDFLFDMKLLIAAELLGDFLEQAEALLKAGYHVPAASLAGAVLENSLRKLSEKNDIAFPEKTKIDSLNSNLAKAGVYGKLVQKEITAKADIRNNADHGWDDKFKVANVEDMIRWIQRFESDYLGA